MSNGIKGLFVFFINICAGWSLSLNAAPSKRPKATTRPPSTLDSQPNTGIKSQVISIPPESQIYHAVYPGHRGGTGEEDDVTPEDLFSYEQLVGKSTAWVYFSHNWYRSRNFPIEIASWIGVSVYGAQKPKTKEWPLFRDLMDEVYPRLESLSTSKPIVLLEFGVTSGNTRGDRLSGLKMR